VHGTAEVQADAAGGELGDDVVGVGDGAGEPVELGDHEGVTGPAGGEGLAQPGPPAVGAGDVVVNVDPVGCTPRAARACRWAVRSWPGADLGIADLHCGYGRSMAGCPTLTRHLCGRVVRERR